MSPPRPPPQHHGYADRYVFLVAAAVDQVGGLIGIIPAETYAR